MSVNLVFYFVIPEAKWLEHQAAILAKEKGHFGGVEDFEEYHYRAFRAHIDPTYLYVDPAARADFKNGKFASPNLKVMSVMLPYDVESYFWTDQLDLSEYHELTGPLSKVQYLEFNIGPNPETVTDKVSADGLDLHIKGITDVLAAKAKEDKAKYGKLFQRFRSLQLRLFCKLAFQYGVNRSVFWGTA